MTNILKRTKKDLLAVLDPGSEVLASIQNRFHHVLRIRQAEGTAIEVTCFFEELPVSPIGEVKPPLSILLRRALEKIRSS